MSPHLRRSKRWLSLLHRSRSKSSKNKRQNPLAVEQLECRTVPSGCSTGSLAMSDAAQAGSSDAGHTQHGSTSASSTDDQCASAASTSSQNASTQSTSAQDSAGQTNSTGNTATQGS